MSEINSTGLISTLDTSESDASASVGALTANSSVADVTKAQLAMSRFQLLATAVSAIIKADGEAKQGTARNIAR